MADLKTIYILHTTNTKKYSGTDADFQLIGVLPGKDFERPFKEWPSGHNEREKGRTDEYRFDVSNSGLTTDSPLNIKMTSTSDGWLPLSMWAIGETTDNEFVVLGHHPEWSQGWFDRGSGSEEEYRIDN